MHSSCKDCDFRLIDYDPRSFRLPCDVEREDCPCGIQYPVSSYRDTQYMGNCKNQSGEWDEFGKYTGCKISPEFRGACNPMGVPECPKREVVAQNQAIQWFNGR